MGFVSAALSVVAGFARRLPKNEYLWAYDIGPAEDPYMTRLAFPRIGGHRLMVHHIHRADGDRHLHNHPWEKAMSLVISGGYMEQRLTGDRLVSTGDINVLGLDDWHRITAVRTDTWTLFLAGKRVRSWGFLVGDDRSGYRVVDHADYLAPDQISPIRT